jgi:hypothetical protein
MWKSQPDFVDRQSPEYLELVEERELCRLLGNDYKDVKWMEALLSRLKSIPPDSGYTVQDRADLEKAKQILRRVRHKAEDAGEEEDGPDLWHDDGDADDEGEGAFPPRPSYVDEDKKTIFPISPEDWHAWNGMVTKRTDVNNTEIIAYRKIFAMEGGFKTVIGSSTMAGITTDALAAAKLDSSLAGKLKGIHVPTDLKGRPGLVLDIYKSYFDINLNLVGGRLALPKVGNVYAATALADTVVREGKSGAGLIILDAVNKVLKGQGLPEIIVTHDPKTPIVVGPRIYSAYSRLATDRDTLWTLLHSVSKARLDAAKEDAKRRNVEVSPGDKLRFSYFEFKDRRR